MSGRNLRESTKKVTEIQQEKSKVAEEIRKLKKTSKALENIRHQEEKLYSESALELAEYTVEHFGSDYEDTSEESSLGENVKPDSDVFGNNIEEVPDNDEWQDPLGVVQTPKSPGPEVSLNIPSASWSTKVNLFFPPNCESTPARTEMIGITSTGSDPPSPVVCLEKIVEENNTSSGNDLTEQETFGEKEILKDTLIIFNLHHFCKSYLVQVHKELACL